MRMINFFKSSVRFTSKEGYLHGFFLIILLGSILYVDHRFELKSSVFDSMNYFRYACFVIILGISIALALKTSQFRVFFLNLIASFNKSVLLTCLLAALILPLEILASFYFKNYLENGFILTTNFLSFAATLYFSLYNLWFFISFNKSGLVE